MLTRFISATSVLLAVSTPVFAQNGSVSLPTAWVDTTYPTQTGLSRTVCASGCTHTTLQAAIDAAVPGDTILLAPGSVHPHVILRGNKPDTGKWIVIRSSSPAFDPGGPLQSGVRVDGSNAQHTSQMARIRSTYSASAIESESNIHHYRLVGLDIAADDNTQSVRTFIELGSDNSTTPAARDIVIDRVYIHGHTWGLHRRGVAMNGARIAVIDSSIAEIHDGGGDENAAGAWNGPGPYKLVNNRLESAGVILMFGGSDPGAQSMNPADVEMRGNLVTRPLAWRNVYPIKNLLELKNLSRALIEGNIFENNWASAQIGHALVFTVRNQGGNCPTCTVQDITFRNNIVRNVPTLLSILGTDYTYPSGYTGDLLFANNLFDHIDYGAYATSGSAHTIVITEGPKYVTFSRNTFINLSDSGSCALLFGGNGTTTGFVFRGNLMRRQEYGILGDNVTPGITALNTYAPGWIFDQNGIAGSSSTHPPNNQYLTPASWEGQFVNYNGGNGGNYRLLSPNAYSSAGNSAVGVDMDALLAATACTSSGNCAGTGGGGGGGGTGNIGTAGSFADQDVGSTGQAGSASYASGLFTVRGAGADIWGSADAFHYVYQPLAGDGQIVARVASLQNTDTYAKAGVMIRESLAAGAPHAILDVRPSGWVEWMTRALPGGETTYLSGANQPVPVWLRLTRAGSTVTADISSNGSSWTKIGNTTIALSQTVFVGLAVTSHNASTLNTATFDNVAVTESQGGIVVQAVDVPASALHGTWTTAADATSPGGVKLTTPDAGSSSLDNPIAAPANYVDVTFNAAAGTPYKLWLRLKARGNSKWNDSAWVQFSDARVNGAAVYPLNTTAGLLVNLATDSAAGSLNGWGWQNGAYWLSQATTVTFAATGAHTIRIQTREDGVELDQIVLSPLRYLSAAPGPVTNDTTIVTNP